jgi:hypothetical protein
LIVLKWKYEKIPGKETNQMEWQVIVILVIAIPVILFPAAFIWYVNAGGLYTAIKEARARRVAKRNRVEKPVKVANN